MRSLVWGLVLLACAEPETPRAQITVFAAASLTDALEDAARAFEEHEATDVTLSFAGSQVLARQIEQGAPADVLIAASEAHVTGAAFEPAATLICNAPALVVPADSAVRSFAELDTIERVVLGTPEVPIGAYAEQILEGAGRQYGGAFEARVRAHVVSRELDTRAVLSRVTEGDANAAIVYTSDAVSVGDAVRTVAIPSEISVVARYPIAIVRRSDERDAARSFVTFIRSDVGQELLVRNGLTRCPP
jgi:molybdate transport system substrate-binding protein